MSIVQRVAQRFSLTIMNGITASIALGAAYLANRNPDWASPIPAVRPLSPTEDAFIRDRFANLGFSFSPENLVFYKAPIEKAASVQIGIIGSPSRAHMYLPESYLMPATAFFKDAYPRLLRSSEYAFEFENQPLAAANQSEAFQEARKRFMEVEPVLPESYEEMDMSLKRAGLSLKLDTEKEIIKSGAVWIASFTFIHQIAAFAIRPVMLFPLLPCAFGIGGMIYKGWQLSDSKIELLADTPEHAATLAHQIAAELAYNKERKKYMSAPNKWFITESGNDWLTDLLSGPTSRKFAVAQNALLGQIYLHQQEEAALTQELGKHFKPKPEEEKDIL